MRALHSSTVHAHYTRPLYTPTIHAHSIIPQPCTHVHYTRPLYTHTVKCKDPLYTPIVDFNRAVCTRPMNTLSVHAYRVQNPCTCPLYTPIDHTYSTRPLYMPAVYSPAHNHWSMYTPTVHADRAQPCPHQLACTRPLYTLTPFCTRPLYMPIEHAFCTRLLYMPNEHAH